MFGKNVARQFERELIRLGVRLPVPLTSAALCEAVGEARGRPIRLMTARLPPGVARCGLLISISKADEPEDVIVYDATAPAVVRDHIIFHELAHLILGHEGDVITLQGAVEMFTELDPALIKSVLGRSPKTYNISDERDAEDIATMLGTRATLGSHETLNDTPDDHVAYRFSGVLADDRKWYA